MATIVRTTVQTLDDLHERLGRVPLNRIRMNPPPGMATERDVLEIQSREKRCCELIDGVLVEKPMGYGESILAVYFVRMLGNFVAPRNLGHVTGEQGMMRLSPGMVRIPDAAFASWSRFPNGRWDGEPIPDLAPDLAVEVLSESNTPEEMKIKVGQYLSSGVRLVWLVDPESRRVTVFEAIDRSFVLNENDTLDGGAALPGFTLSIAEMFGEFDRHG